MIEGSSNAKGELTKLSNENEILLSKLHDLEDLFKTTKERNTRFEAEVEDLRKQFKDGWAQFQEREDSLTSLIETKTKETSEFVNQIKTLEVQFNKMQEERNKLQEEVQIRKVLNSANQVLVTRCTCFDENTTDAQEVIKNINNVGRRWRETDEAELTSAHEHLNSLEETVKALNSQILIKKTASQSNSLRNHVLVDSILEYKTIKEEFEASRISFDEISSSKVGIQSITSKLCAEHELLLASLENCKNEKESLASKLEEVHEQLISERVSSQKLCESYESLREENRKLEDKIKEEILTQNRLKEQLTVEKDQMANTAEHIKKLNDLDANVQVLLYQAGLSGCMQKSDKGYAFNGSQLVLALHPDHLVVVVDKTGSIPLLEYLKNSKNTEKKPEKKSDIKPEKKSDIKPEKKSENKAVNNPDTSKSPIRVLQLPISQAIKSVKTPLRERNSSQSGRKRVFK